jgi:hypothetical protein
MNAEQIAAALGPPSYLSGEWWRAPCPVHNSTGPTLSLKDGRRGLIACCHAGCDWQDVLAELRRLGLLGGAHRACPRMVGARNRPGRRDRQKLLDSAPSRRAADPADTPLVAVVVAPSGRQCRAGHGRPGRTR